MPALALRLFPEPPPASVPPSPPKIDRSTWTIAEAVDGYIDDVLRPNGGKAATMTQYRTARRYWDDWMESRQPGLLDLTENHRSMRPVVLLAAETTTAELKEFRNWVQQRAKGKNPSRTANKQLSCLKTVLTWLHEEEGTQPPHFPKPLKTQSVADKLYLSLDELDRLYDATTRASWPTVNGSLKPLWHPPGVYWRCLLALYFNYGFDTQMLTAYAADKQPLCWRHIRWAPEYPGDDSNATNDHGWLWYVRTKTAGAKPEPLVMPLNACVAAHLKSIAPPNGCDPDARLFDFPRCRKSLDVQWSALCHVANVRPKPDLHTGQERKYLLKHLRKTCSTYHETNMPGVSPLILGHAKRALSEITYRHYAHPAMALVEALNSLTQPSTFARIFETEDPQQMLF